MKKMLPFKSLAKDKQLQRLWAHELRSLFLFSLSPSFPLLSKSNTLIHSFLRLMEGYLSENEATDILNRVAISTGMASILLRFSSTPKAAPMSLSYVKSEDGCVQVGHTRICSGPSGYSQPEFKQDSSKEVKIKMFYHCLADLILHQKKNFTSVYVRKWTKQDGLQETTIPIETFERLKDKESQVPVKKQAASEGYRLLNDSKWKQRYKELHLEHAQVLQELEHLKTLVSQYESFSHLPHVGLNPSTPESAHAKKIFCFLLLWHKR